MYQSGKVVELNEMERNKQARRDGQLNTRGLIQETVPGKAREGRAEGCRAAESFLLIQSGMRTDTVPSRKGKGVFTNQRRVSAQPLDIYPH